MTGYIYKITNLINQKAYIGKTVGSIEERWKEHKRDCKRFSDRPLYRALNKYGIDNFKVELVEEVDIKDLSEREIYWIGYYHTYTEGYNATLGGDGKILYDYDLIVELIHNQYSTQEIIQMVGCCAEVVQLVARKNNLSIAKKSKDCIHEKQPIDQYDKNGNYLRSFESIRDASRWLEENNYVSGHLNGVVSHISDVCKGKRKSAYKFIWKNSK